MTHRRSLGPRIGLWAWGGLLVGMLTSKAVAQSPLWFVPYPGSTDAGASDRTDASSGELPGRVEGPSAPTDESAASEPGWGDTGADEPGWDAPSEEPGWDTPAEELGASASASSGDPSQGPAAAGLEPARAAGDASSAAGGPLFDVALHGFAEGAVGSRLGDSAVVPGHLVLAETRGRVDLSHARAGADAALQLDVVADGVAGAVRPELRQASVRVQPASMLELSAGHRVLTWGTGDFVFVNDLFPKDYVSFFIGRADEFLKTPVRHAKLSLFGGPMNLDLVYMPIFSPDTVPSGERLGFYSPLTGERVGEEGALHAERPKLRLQAGEVAARVYGSLGSLEWALYGYLGRTKQPLAFDAEAMLPRYARLGVYGLSLRFPLLGGLFNAEGALYDAMTNRDGDDPSEPPSQVRAVVGYEHELVTKLVAALQYYVESPFHGAAGSHLVSAMAGYVERHWLTLRITARLLHDDLTLSAFGIVAPFDEPEGHLRAHVAYRVRDGVLATLGANFMRGRADTFFGQFADSSNVYARLRCTF